jgi:hypothetical protein
MKIIKILSVCIIIMLAGACSYNANEISDTDIETKVRVMGEDGVYSDVPAQTDPGISAYIEDEKLLSDLIAEFDWVDSAAVAVSSDGGLVTGVLNVTRDPAKEETDEVIKLIMSRLENVKEENIIITDGDGNVIYPY